MKRFILSLLIALLCLSSIICLSSCDIMDRFAYNDNDDDDDNDGDNNYGGSFCIHKETVVNGKKATCMESGLTNGKVCSKCNTVLKEQKVIEPLGHDESTVYGKPASCSETGLTDGKKCSRCDLVLVTQETIPLLAHTKNGTTCSVCGSICDSEGLSFTLSFNRKYYTVTGIGTCTDTQIIIPSTYNGLPVSSIGKEAFKGCVNITSVSIPDSITSIGYGAFYGCSGLTGIVIPDGVTSIGEYIFYGCSSLSSVTLGKGITYITDSAFYGCSRLSAVNIPDSVKIIGSCAFADCSSLTSIDIPDSSFISIGKDAFSGCTGISESENGITYVDKWAVAYSGSSTSVTLRSDTHGIADYLFENHTEITDFTIPNSLIYIGNYAFSGCTEISAIVIPNSVKEIGMYAFQDCSYLTSVSIGNGVTYIGTNAFINCSFLNKVSINSVEAWFNIDFKNIGANPLTYAKNLYLDDSVIAHLYIPNTVTTIKGYAFNGCDSLLSVTVSNSVTCISGSSFVDCDNLTDIHFTVTSGWFHTSDASVARGHTVTVTDSKENAVNLRENAILEYWMRNT